jgi:poly-gamma-glutamate synthesis protein (capsule biosynthesis protein)
LTELRLAPFQARQLQLHRASERDAEWMRGVLDNVSRRFGSRVDWGAEGFLNLDIAL